MCVCVLSESSFPVCFLFRSRGVFHFLPALPQSRSGFLHVFQRNETYIVWLCTLVCISVPKCAWNICGRWRRRGHTQKRQRFSAVFWCDPRPVYVNTAWHLWGQTLIRKYMVTFPHSDVSACEILVRNQPVSIHFEFLSFLFGPPALLHPSSLPPDQTFSFISDYYREVTGSTLLAHTLTDMPHKRKSWLLFTWLALPSLMKHQFSCYTGRMFLLPVWVLLFWPLLTLLLAACCAGITAASLVCCFVIGIKRECLLFTGYDPVKCIV